MMIDKYLPVGTVVLLKEQNKRFMITGFGVKSEEYNNKVFDYSGCLYPEGVLTLKETIVFDHEQIGKIYFMGFIDEEEKAFKVQLNEAINKMKNEIESEEGIDIPKSIENLSFNEDSTEVFNID